MERSVLNTGFIERPDLHEDQGDSRPILQDIANTTETQEVEIPHFIARLQEGQVFQSFEDFKEALNEYTDHIKVPYITKHSFTVDRYNKSRSEDNQLPAHLRYKRAEFQCKHYGTHTIEGTGCRDTT